MRDFKYNPKQPDVGVLAAFKEVCQQDYYKVRHLPFVPDVIFDLGANVGVFTTFVRFLFPEARIVAVEPNPPNYAYLRRFTSHLPGIEYVNKALGLGEIWEGLCTPQPPYYGGLHSYVTADQPGFPRSQMTSPPGQEGRDARPVYWRSLIQPVQLDELVNKYVSDRDKFLLKMDCEGGENCIFGHEPSMRALRRADCITMETHAYAKGTGTEEEEVMETVIAGLGQLSKTHYCDFEPELRRFRAIRIEFGDLVWQDLNLLPKS